MLVSVLQVYSTLTLNKYGKDCNVIGLTDSRYYFLFSKTTVKKKKKKKGFG